MRSFDLFALKGYDPGMGFGGSAHMVAPERFLSLYGNVLKKILIRKPLVEKEN